MEYEALVRMAKAAAALAVEARIMGQDGAAWNLVQAGDELERAAADIAREGVEAATLVREITTE